MRDSVRQIVDWVLEAQTLAKCADQALEAGDRETGAALIAQLYSMFDQAGEIADRCDALH